MRRIAVGVALELAACQAGPAPRAPKAIALSAGERLRAEGEAFFAKADYVDAIEKYRQAADLDPAAVAPRFDLGTAYSFLDKRPEAIVQFRWVMDHAAATSTEYQDAQRWLTRVGALTAASAQTDLAGTADPTTGLGRLVGRTEWPGLTPHTSRITGTLSLIGDEPATFDVKRSREFGLGDKYGFRDVPAGRYRIVAVIDETTIWNESVTVEAGKDTTLTLSQSSSPVPTDRFAPPATSGAEGSPGSRRE
ncbi:MAG TPA: tetratricopeptide repeat protein [Actinomycetota bacterium]